MIVICEQCQSRFKLDESRLPQGGARVRCSKCKHAFFLPAPGGDEPDLLDELVSQTAAEPLRAPPPTRDVGPEISSPLLPRVDPPPPETPGETPSAPAREPEAGENDWEFTEDVPGDGTEEAPEAAEPEGLERNDALPDLLADPPDLEETRAPTAAASEGADAGRASTLGEVPAPVEETDAGTAEADLGWDFDDDEDPIGEIPQLDSPPTPSPSATPIARIQLVKMGAKPIIEPEPAEQLLEPPEKLGTLLGAAGWLATIVFAGLVAVQLLLPAPPAVGSHAPLAAGPLVAESVEGRFVDNLFVGPLLVATADLYNPRDEPVALGAVLHAVLVDGEGRPIPRSQAALAPVAARELRELSPEVLAARLALRGRALAARVLPPGERVRVTGVFPAPSPEARDLSLELGPRVAAPSPTPDDAAKGPEKP